MLLSSRYDRWFLGWRVLDGLVHRPFKILLFAGKSSFLPLSVARLIECHLAKWLRTLGLQHFERDQGQIVWPEVNIAVRRLGEIWPQPRCGSWQVSNIEDNANAIRAPFGAQTHPCPQDPQHLMLFEPSFLVKRLALTHGVGMKCG